MSSRSESYWSHSWALLTRDEGWFKPLLVLAAARMIPVIGTFGADGYALEWARLTSWGIESSPKQKNVNVGACIAAGARAFVVAIGYLFAIGLIRTLLNVLLGAALGGLLSMGIGVLGAVLIVVAKLRATIYQSIGAGYHLPRILDMIERDPEGLLRIAGMYAVMMLAVGAAASFLIVGALLTNIGTIVRELIEYETYGYVDDIYVVGTVFSAIGKSMPALCVAGYLIGIATSAMSLLASTAVGLWMRQFDVSRWGESGDPLPTAEAAAPASSTHASDPGFGTSSATAAGCSSTDYSYGTDASVPLDNLQNKPADDVPAAPDVPQEAPDFGATDTTASDFGAWGLVEDQADVQAADDAPDVKAVIDSFDNVVPQTPEVDVPSTSEFVPSEPAPSESVSPVPMFPLSGIHMEPRDDEAPAPEADEDADDMLEEFEEAIKAADMSVPDDEPADDEPEQDSIELGVPGREEAPIPGETGERVIDAIDLTDANPDEEFGQ